MLEDHILKRHKVYNIVDPDTSLMVARMSVFDEEIRPQSNASCVMGWVMPIDHGKVTVTHPGQQNGESC